MDREQFRRIQTRRSFFQECAGGIGIMALAQLMEQEGRGAVDRGQSAGAQAAALPAQGQERDLHVHGGRTQPDRSLRSQAGACRSGAASRCRESMTKDLRLAFTKPNAAVLASPRTFQPYGKSGIEFSDYIPHIGACADDLCLVRSMFTDAFNHHPGQLLLFGGSIQVGRPTMGAWVLYGLGSESQNLPGFVVLSSGVGTSGGTSNWSSGFLPSTYQRRVVSQLGRPGAVPFESAGRDQGDAARGAGRAERSQPGALRRDRRRGDRVADRVVRAGVPHADGGAGAAGFFEGIAGDAGDVRRRATSGEMPALRSSSPPTACWRGAWWSAACDS